MPTKRNEPLIAKRKDRKLLQEQVAEAVGISTRYYRNIEAGISKPNVETAISIANLLGCAVTDLFDPRRQPEKNITQPNSNTDKEDVRTGKDPAVAAAEVSKEDGLIVKLLRAVCESKDIPATLTVEVLADGIGAEERWVFKKEIQEAVVALQGAEAALG